MKRLGDARKSDVIAAHCIDEWFRHENSVSAEAGVRLIAAAVLRFVNSGT